MKLKKEREKSIKNSKKKRKEKKEGWLSICK
jgi:hypothetical protein